MWVSVTNDKVNKISCDGINLEKLTLSTLCLAVAKHRQLGSSHEMMSGIYKPGISGIYTSPAFEGLRFKIMYCNRLFAGSHIACVSC